LFKSWKSRAAVFAVAASMAVPVLGIASPAGADPPKDQATGTVQGPGSTAIGLRPFKVHINASSTSPGDSKGRFDVDIDAGGTIGLVSYSGSVGCLTTIGNNAYMRGVVDKTNNSAIEPAGTAAFIRFVDNGQGANDPPDQFGVFNIFGGPPCPVINASTTPATSGNVTVFDGV